MKSNSDATKATGFRECYGINISNTYILYSRFIWQEIDRLQKLYRNGHRTYEVETLVSQNYLYYEFIGKAFEYLYKTLILVEGTDHEFKHEITILHKQLTPLSQQRIEKIVIDHGWNHFKDFLHYVDTYLTDPNKKYFHGDLNSSYGHPDQLVSIYTNLIDNVVSIIASENNKVFLPNEGMIIKNKI